jgi:hypothetical protein
MLFKALCPHPQDFAGEPEICRSIEIATKIKPAKQPVIIYFEKLKLINYSIDLNYTYKSQNIIVICY